MSREGWIGIFLITILMFLWTLWLAYSARPQAPQKENPVPTDSIEKTTPATEDRPEQALDIGPYARFIGLPESVLVVQTPLYRAFFRTTGAALMSLELTRYQDASGKPVTLWDERQKSELTFAEGRYLIPLHKLSFEVTYLPKTPIEKAPDSAVFRLTLAKDTFIQVVYRFQPEDYHIEREIIFQNFNDRLRNPYLVHHVIIETPQTERSASLMQPYTALYYRQGEDVDYLQPDEDEKIEKTFQGNIYWISAKGHFFTQLFRNDAGYSAVTLRSLPFSKGELPKYEITLQLPMEEGRLRESLYLGPLRYTYLKKYGRDYEKQLNLGWSFIRYINTGFIIPVFQVLEKYIPSYGIIIAILALLVKILLSPLTWQSYLAGARMQVINELPEVKALDEKYKDDPNKLMMEKSLLYRELGVNPLSGCIPLLLQMPLFFAMVSFFPSAFELRQESFLWAKDLSTYDDLIRWGFHIPILGEHISLFALMTALTTLAYTLLSPQSTSTTTPGMKWLPYLTPVIFFLFLNSYSAALSWYYTVLNILTITQTLIMRRMVDKEAIIQKLRQRRQKRSNAGVMRQSVPRWLRQAGKRR